MPDAPCVLFLPEPGAWGPTNSLAAMAEVLLDRGHRVVFMLDESFAGVLQARGFEERHVRVADLPEREEVVGDIWVTWVRENKRHFQGSTLGQLSTVIRPIWEELIEASRYSHARIVQIIDEVAPDVIVVDNVAAYPAVAASGIPWVRSVSANPLELHDSDLPPAFSGYTARDRGGWQDFRDEYRRVHADLHAEFSQFCVEQGAPALADLEFQYQSPWLNLYAFPAEIDYRRSRPLPDTWHRLDTTVRLGERPFAVDEHLPGEGPVIYLSLGSLGSLDIKLMQRLIDVLDTTGQRVIVSMGTLHEQLRLGENMYGGEFLPQPSILDQCDLLITHGGNNTFNEAFYFGLPTIVLPLFWDQYDNAQRAADLGLGIRLDTYGFEESDLTGALERLLSDDALRGRLGAMRENIRRRPGRQLGAELIAQVAATRRPVPA